MSYPVWMLQKVLEQTRGKTIDLYLTYDVACMLQKHLKVKFTAVFLELMFTAFIWLLGHGLVSRS